MSNTDLMGGNTQTPWHSPTQRVLLLKERLLNPERLLSIGDMKPHLPEDFRKIPHIVRRGTLLAAMLDELVTPVREGELLVGDVPYKEFLANCDLFPTHLTEDESDQLRSAAAGKFCSVTGKSKATDFGLYEPVFSIYRNHGHIIADYERPLNIGFGGIAEKIEQRLEDTQEAESQRQFLTSALLYIRSAERYIRRYAAECDRLAGECSGKERRAELRRIARTCAHISSEAPRDFREAIQLVWFTQLLLEIESGLSAFSLGRFDQYLYPFLRSDLDSGALSHEEAQELVDCFWVAASQHNRCGDPARAVTIGGIGQDGTDKVNELTYMMLQAAGSLQLVQPKLNARIHSASPGEYIRLCCRVASNNTGPMLYNDDQTIPALVNFGFAHEDAVEYGLIGCYETGIPGKERPWPMSGCLNLGKCLELALNDGACRLTGTQLGPMTGKLSGLKSFSDIERAYQEQVAFFTEVMAEKNVLDEFDDEWMHPQPFLSTLMSGCIESGRDISAGGALHTNVGIRCTGLSAVADSLMALRSLVFDQHVVSLEELDKALSEDFAESESLRQTLINRAAKFGNDEDSVDLIARSIGEHFCLEVMKHRGIRGGKFKPGLFSYYDFTWTGRHCGALPSGRKARQPFANGVTPMRGMDRLGPTAMLSSASKLNYALSPNANTLDMKLSSQTMNGEDGIDRLSKLVKAYFDMGGMQLQLSVLSTEDLLDAKRNPQEHQNLLVRVAGWSAFFVTLSDEAQNEIISRSEHSLV